jgi:hypothetical protein
MSDNQSIPETTGNLSTDDIVDLLGEDSSEGETDETKDTSEDSESSEDTSEDAEGEDETSEDDDESTETNVEDAELEFHDIPKRKEILKEFPELFKKFPGMEKAIYREQQYAEVFPTIADAKNANERLGIFNRVESDLMSGNIEPVLDAIKKNSKDGFEKIGDTILEALQKVDQDTYYGVMTKVIQNAIYSAFDSGKESNDEQLQIAAQLLNRFFFKNIEPKPFKKPEAKNVNPEADKLRQDRIEFNRQLLDNAANDVNTRTTNVIKSTIDKHLDPRGIMTPYVRGKATADILGEIDKALMTDARFKGIVDKLWQKAATENYSESSKIQIRNALISRARTLLPGIMQKVKSEAMKGQQTRKIRDKEPESKAPLPRQRAEGSTKSKSDGKVPRGVSTLDFLMSED